MLSRWLSIVPNAGPIDKSPGEIMEDDRGATIAHRFARFLGRLDTKWEKFFSIVDLVRARARW
jgi:hypothetical protein